MCLKAILNLFQKSKPNSQYEPVPESPTTPPTPIPALPPIPVTIPFPEEPFDPTQTAKTNIETFRTAWLTNYQVPTDQWSYWHQTMDIAFSTDLNNPAWAWNDSSGFHIRFNIGWANAGTLAYESAHVAWALLTDAQKTGYKTAFDAVVVADPRFVLLFQEKPHELVADEDTTGDIRIGGHAETYRCIGPGMPESLKIYYPKLF